MSTAKFLLMSGLSGCLLFSGTAASSAAEPLAGCERQDFQPGQAELQAGLSLILYQPDDALLQNYAPYQEKIIALHDYLAAHPCVGLLLEGHTDQRNSAEYSFALAQRYADSVQKYLLSQGFAATRIQAVSLGKEKPAVSGNNRKAWAKNRRVEIRLRRIDAARAE